MYVIQHIPTNVCCILRDEIPHEKVISTNEKRNQRSVKVEQGGEKGIAGK